MTDSQAKPIRSPSYPGMPLKDAVAAVGRIEGPYRSSPVDRTAGAKLIGYSSLSGPANQALAALASYGLIERAGKGEMRVTPRAKAILHPENPEERKQSLLAAAFEPQLYRDLRERFADVKVPPEEGVVSYLNRQGFNKNSIRSAAKAFLDTIEYLEEVGASESHVPSTKEGKESDPPSEGVKPKFGGAKIGDLVQWESDNVLRFDRPKRVRWISDDGEWLAVDESNTGIPMSQTIVQDRPDGQSQVPPPYTPPPPPADEEVSLATDLRFKVGKGIVVKVTSPEELGAAELDKLVTLLTAQSTALKD